LNLKALQGVSARGVLPCVVLVRPTGPLNVGLVARACANFEASLRLVQCSADLSSVEFRMTCVHAEHVVSRMQRFETLADAVRDLEWVVGTCGLARDKRLSMFAPAELGRAASERSVRRLGLVFGNEADGLANDELAACDAYVCIPASQRQPSLNLSHAAAVLLARLYDDSLEQATAGAPTHAASREELETLRGTWVELMRERGYFSRASEARLPASLDRMFRRWGMLRGDVRTMMGMLRHLSQDE
jgi:tRNA/rRNA methyltransferase